MYKYRDFLLDFKHCDMLIIQLDTDLSKFMNNPMASYVMWEYGAKHSNNLIKSDFKKTESILFADNNFVIPRVLIVSNKIHIEKIISILKELKPKRVLIGGLKKQSISIKENLEKNNFKTMNTTILDDREFLFIKKIVA